MESLFIIYTYINRNKYFCYKTIPYIRNCLELYYGKGKNSQCTSIGNRLSLGQGGADRLPS
jgi:hypothetical protein